MNEQGILKTWTTDWQIAKEESYIEELGKLQDIASPIFVEIMLSSDEIKEIIEMKKRHVEELKKRLNKT